ncbi:MAG: universal stress protein [Schleiferiaceae bacterium]|nr:universal stress protein [Schleiferiaceae bacterium]
MKNIAICIDFSSQTQTLIDAAIPLGEQLKAKIWLIHIAAPEPDFVGYSVGPDYIREDRAETLKEEHQFLGEYKDQLKTNGIDCEALLIQGPTVETILNEVEKLNIDVLVMGKTGHGALHKMLIGSTFDAVIKKAQIPVLAIPLK